MKTYLVFIFIICLSIIKCQANEDLNDVKIISKVKCFLIDLDNNLSFNLLELVRKDDRELIYNYDEKNLIAYSLCNNNIIYGGSSTQMAILNQNYEFKTGLSGDYMDFNNWNYNEDNDKKLLVINNNPGKNCKDNINYTSSWQLVCDETMNEKLKIIDVVKDDCSVTIFAKSPSICPKFGRYYFSYLFSQSLPFAIILILVGLYLLFFSFLQKLTLFIILIIQNTYIVGLIFHIALDTSNNNGGIFILLTTSISGFVFGSLIFYNHIYKERFKTFPSFFSGILFGYLWAVFFYLAFLNKIHYTPIKVFWFTAGILMFGTGTASIKNSKMMPGCISFLGSYFITKGVSYFLGGFPSEFVVMDLIYYQEWSQLDLILNGVIYAYLGCWFILYFISSLIYFKRNKPVVLILDNENFEDDPPLNEDEINEAR